MVEIGPVRPSNAGLSRSRYARSTRLSSRAGSVVTKSTCTRCCSALSSFAYAEAIVPITTWQMSGHFV